MDLNTRLQILKDAGQISEKNFNTMHDVIKTFKEKWGILLTEENGAMFITHLSVAVERVMKGETVGTLDEDIFKEVRENKNYDKCLRMFREIEKLFNLKIPDSERGFIMVHLCTLLDSVMKQQK